MLLLYALINQILALPTQNVNGTTQQAAVAILVISFVVVLYALFSFFGRIFSLR